MHLIRLFICLVGLVQIPVGYCFAGSCDAVAENTLTEYYEDYCPVEGSGGCYGVIMKRTHTFQCVEDGYQCPVACWERPYFDYVLRHCLCVQGGGINADWQITNRHTCDVCPPYPVPIYPWDPGYEI